MSMGYYMTEGKESEEALGYIIGKIFGWIFDLIVGLFGIHLSGGERFLLILATIGLIIYICYKHNNPSHTPN